MAGFLPPKKDVKKKTKQTANILDVIGQAGASAVGTVAKGAGNLVSAAGQAASYLDPIATAGRVSKTLTGNEGVFAGYRSPIEMAGRTVQRGTEALGSAAERGSVAMSGLSGEQPITSAQWAGGALGNIANLVGGVGVGAKLAGAVVPAGKAVTVAGQIPFKTSVVPKFLAQSVGATEGITAVQEGRLASPGELAGGVAIDVGTLGAGRAMQRLAKEGLKNVPRLTPGVKEELGEKGLARMGELMYTDVDKLPLLPTQTQVYSVMNEARKKTYKEVEKHISSAVQKGAGKTNIDELMRGVRENVLSPKGASRAGLSLDQVPVAKKELNKVGDFYKEFFGTKELSLPQAQILKKALKYKKDVGQDAITSTVSQFREGLRKNTQKYIEDEVGRTVGVNAKTALQQANLDYNILKKLSQSLKKKRPYSGYLTDVIAGAGAIGGSMARLDVGGAIKGASVAIGLKRLATSPKPKVLAAKIIKKGTKKEVNQFFNALVKSALVQVNREQKK